MTTTTKNEISIPPLMASVHLVFCWFSAYCRKSLVQPILPPDAAENLSGSGVPFVECLTRKILARTLTFQAPSAWSDFVPPSDENYVEFLQQIYSNTNDRTKLLVLNRSPLCVPGIGDSSSDLLLPPCANMSSHLLVGPLASYQVQINGSAPSSVAAAIGYLFDYGGALIDCRGRSSDLLKSSVT